jgi:hypothetical protein
MHNPPEDAMRITIDLRKTEYDRLAEVAKAERRPLRDQAAWIVANAISKENKEAAMTP